MTAYNRRFGKAPRHDFDVHRPLETDDDLTAFFTWREPRRVSKSLTVQYDKVLYLIEDNELSRRAIGKYIEVWHYPDGRKELRLNGVVLPYSTYDRLQEIDQGAIVDNKRLGRTLEFIKLVQDKPDLNDLFKIYGDPATNTFNPAGPYPNIDHAKMVMNRWLDHWQTHSFGNWAISLLTNPEKIIGFGGLGIRNYDDIVINNLGYRLSTEAWGKGLATEFAIYAIKFGFDVIKLTEISAVVRENHLASQKVLQKSGLRYVKEIHDVKDAPPSLLYSISVDEWLRNLEVNASV